MATQPGVSASDLRVVTAEMQEAFRRAMRAHERGHCFQEAAARLTELQGKVSHQWLGTLINGPVNTPQRQRPRKVNLPLAMAISEYMAEVGITSLAVPPALADSDAPDPAADIDLFSASFVAEGEPELGGRRARLIDAVLRRLETAEGRLTEVEERLISWVSQVERLDPPHQGSGPRPGPGVAAQQPAGESGSR